MSHTALSLCADNATDEDKKNGKTAKAILRGLQELIGPQRFNAWFRHGTNLSVESGRVQVSVPNPFVANWIDTHFRGEIAAVAKGVIEEDCNVIVVVDPSLTGELKPAQLDKQARIVETVSQGRTRRPRAKSPISLKYKMKDFVVGESNKLAYSAAHAVIGDKRAIFHPLFIHGPCGVGKTHLLQGICEAAAKRTRGDKPVKWRYVTGEQFTNEFVRAVRSKSFGDFRARFRNLDLLAIDDVHFLASKKAIQEEFLHTFNAIESAGKQVVLASDAHPQMVGELSGHLSSRFVAGMVVKIQAPDKATRSEILRRKAAVMKLKVEGEILDYIACHVRGSARELEGTLFKLAALSALSNGPVDLQMARDALSDHLARTDSAITVGDIEAVVAAFFGITPADIHSTRRTRTVSAARMLAMHFARRHTTMSYPEIGRFMGKNHSSVILAVQKMEAALANNDEIVWAGVMGKKSMRARELSELISGQIV